MSIDNLGESWQVLESSPARFCILNEEELTKPINSSHYYNPQQLISPEQLDKSLTTLDLCQIANLTPGSYFNKPFEGKIVPFRAFLAGQSERVLVAEDLLKTYAQFVRILGGNHQMSHFARELRTSAAFTRFALAVGIELAPINES